MGLRGDLPIGPVTSRSIFRLQGEKVAALKERYAPGLIFLVMTSKTVHQSTMSSFQREAFFGIPPKDVWFFPQDSLPILDQQDQPLPQSSPTGHGGFLEALKKHDLITRLKERQIEYLFYFQYPNVLEKIFDPVLLGYHHEGGFEVTTKAISKYAPEEKMGRCVEIDNKLNIVEYYFIREMNKDNWTNSVPASIATHIWNISFLEKCIKENVTLPYYKLPHHAEASRNFTGFKLEQFIFDLLPYSIKNGLVVVNREEEFAPVKTLSGPDSLESGRQALSKMYINWLNRAGAKPRYAQQEKWRIEISPLYAQSSEELADKLPKDFYYFDGLLLPL